MRKRIIAAAVPILLILIIITVFAVKKLSTAALYDFYLSVCDADDLFVDADDTIWISDGTSGEKKILRKAKSEFEEKDLPFELEVFEIRGTTLRFNVQTDMKVWLGVGVFRLEILRGGKWYSLPLYDVDTNVFVVDGKSQRPGKIELMGGKALDKYLPSGRYRIVLEREDGNTSVEFEMKNKDNTYELVK